MRYLRQSTIVTLHVGPFLDATDGVTPETALSVTVQVGKNGAVFVARNSGTAITHDADGFYRVALSATDTDTSGSLIVKSVVAGAAPVWHECTVLQSARYDLAILGTGTQNVNVATIDAAALDAILDDPIAEPTAIWTWPGSLRKILGFIGALSRNKITQTSTTQLVRNDADSATIGTATHADDGTTHTRGEFS